MAMHSPRMSRWCPSETDSPGDTVKTGAARHFRCAQVVTHGMRYSDEIDAIPTGNISQDDIVLASEAYAGMLRILYD